MESTLRRLSVDFCPLLYASVLLCSDRRTLARGLQLSLVPTVWSVSTLRLRSYPSSSRLSREMIRSLVYYALRVWSEPTPLDFHEVGCIAPGLRLRGVAGVFKDINLPQFSMQQMY